MLDAGYLMLDAGYWFTLRKKTKGGFFFFSKIFFTCYRGAPDFHCLFFHDFRGTTFNKNAAASSRTVVLKAFMCFVFLI